MNIDFKERYDELINKKGTKVRDFTIEEPPLPDCHKFDKIYCHNCCGQHLFENCTKKKSAAFWTTSFKSYSNIGEQKNNKRM